MAVSATGADPIGVIVNPKAGGGKGLALLPRIEATLQALGQPHHLHVTTAPGEAIAVARRFALDGLPVVVAVGGDGTVNEVANGLLASERPVCLGVLPAGRGRDFARAIAMPRDPREGLSEILKRRPRRIDAGLATFGDGSSRFFVNAAGLGFDTAVAERAQRSRLPGSTLPYLGAVLGALIQHHNIRVVVEVDGERAEETAFWVLVANSCFLGGGMKLCPTATLADGRLDLAIFGDLSTLDVIRNLPRIYRGTHVGHPKYRHVPAQSIRVETAAPVRIQLDGELAGAAPVTFTVRPGALLVAG